MKRAVLLSLLSIIAFVFTASIFAGDVANFVDLGFSDDYNIYLFAQYGVRESNLHPFADMRIVDVKQNDFVQGGVFSYTHNDRVTPGQDGAGALFRLISRNAGKIEKWAIPFVRQGVPLYVTLKNGHDPFSNDISFRDFDAGTTWSAKLNCSYEGEGDSARSWFSVTVSCANANGPAFTKKIGSPEIKRKNISSYSIKKVIVPPDRSSIIFVIETKSPSGDLRYMVETLTLGK
jgi:predicted secreted protein